MGTANETIELDISESNELAFKIRVEGIRQAPAKVRLVCENENVSYMFKGRSTGEDGIVKFVLPKMVGKLTEGSHPARVEVLIEDRYFSPVQFNILFKRPFGIVAESAGSRSVPSKLRVVTKRADKPSKRVDEKLDIEEMIREITQEIAKKKRR